jgi:hypothetical protein
MTDSIFSIFYDSIVREIIIFSRLPFNFLEKDNRTVKKDRGANKSALQATLFHKFSFYKHSENDAIASYDIQIFSTKRDIKNAGCIHREIFKATEKLCKKLLVA